MFDPKNLSPRKLSFFTALGLAAPISLIDLAIEHEWKAALISFLVVLIGGYLLISIVLERFIYRKIKVIYKFIYQTKATRRQETYYKYILPKKAWTK